MKTNMYSVLLIGLSTSFFVIDCKKPNDKEQQVVWRLECELGLITDSECPVDGSWTPWSPWSACNGHCDEVGHRRRIRECNNPAPSPDGLPCTGVDYQVEPCYISNCTVRDYRKLVEGDAIRSAALRQLEAVPALMERCLQMECPFEAIEAGLATENTWQINPESLWNSFQCVKHNLGCPVLGEWGPWSEWSACGARCGFGLRWKIRKCDTPPPSNPQLFCSGSPLQVDECEGDQCAVHKRDAGGKWGDWEQWSACSENCGAGIRRRKRTCLETNTPRLFGSWGTHCRGQHDQLEVCENQECKLDGGWSGWGAWGMCSQTCGAGRRSRFRACTRPEPAGGGIFCNGARTEVGTCHLRPCKSFSHIVAVFNGESALTYNFRNKRSTLFHFYVRFLPLSSHGTLVRRGSSQYPLIRLSLQKWHVCLDASGRSRSCTVSRICSPKSLEPAVWHSVLVFITSKDSTMRLDDEPVVTRSTFSCDPELPNENVNIVVGEKLHGEIQELILNFIPLSLAINSKTNPNFCPSKVSNTAFERAGEEEGYLRLENDNYLRLPCSANREDWQIKLTVKPKTESGTIIFLQDCKSHSWLHLYLVSMRLKLKLAVADFRSESVSYSDCPPGQWLDITMAKRKGTNTIEVTMNFGERLHVLFEDIEGFAKRRRKYENNSMIRSADQESKIALCTDEYFVGGVPINVKEILVSEDFTSFAGIIASMNVNNVFLDLHVYSLERYKDNNLQVSSRTASVSGSYHETAWGNSNRLNLTCLHTRYARSPNTAHWLFLDTVISATSKDKTVRSIDDGKVLKLVATADNDPRGFYTCRAHSKRHTRNVVTYGVIGKQIYNLSGPDLTTAVAVITTLALVVGTLVCLFIEGIHDIRNGYGFYRDPHFSPEEEAESICKYIDQNMHLMASKSAADAAKAKARLIGRQMACRSSVSAQEPQGFMQIENLVISSEESIPSEPEGLPVLPEINSSGMEPAHDVFRCEQSYISSPRHGTISSPRTNLASSSSVDLSSPSYICSRLLLAQRLHSSLESLASKKKNSRLPRRKRRLLTIKSSTYINQSPAQKILQKFRDLKSEDT